MHGSNPDLNGGSFALSPAELNSLRQGHPLLRCLNVLNHVMQQPAAAPFCSQVNHAPGLSGKIVSSRGMDGLVSPSRHMLFGPIGTGSGGPAGSVYLWQALT